MRTSAKNLVIVCAVLGAGISAFAQQAPAPASLRNQELELRLKASLAKSSGVWGVSVKHIEKNEFAAINDGLKFQMASVFKIPILVELFAQVKSGKVRLEDRVEWKEPQRFFGSGILVTLNTGLQPTIRDLAELMIIVSDNAATDMLLERLGPGMVTARMRILGLSQTSVEAGTRDLILQALGLRSEEDRKLTRETLRAVDWGGRAQEIEQNRRKFLDECPNCTTPAEMSQLLEQIARAETSDQPSSDQMLRILSQQQFNQRLPRWIPLGTRFDHKTGTLTGPVWVVNDAGILYLPNGYRVIVSVFSRGAEMNLSPAEMKVAISNAEDRIAEIGKIVWDYYSADRK
jgi:beta-lactamase class A